MEPDSNRESKMNADESVPLKDFTPRSYQKEIFEVARSKNTIAVLPTGSGKTMIAVMLIKEVSPHHNKLIIFLAPKVNLVNQQFEVIRNHTDLRVKQYYGALGVDDWDSKSWDKEVQEHDVMVMTPQILLDALRKAFLNLNLICLMVFDECHNATGNHPYSKIMKEFYHKSGDKPKIFGLTASPVIRKGVSSAVDCEDQISTLESLLDSKVYAIEDNTELEIFVPSSKEMTRYYESNTFSHEQLKKKLESYWCKYDKLLVNKQSSLPNHFKDTDEVFKTLRKKLLGYYSKILHCLDGLGFLCAYEAAKVCMENARVSISTEECELYRMSFFQCRNFLEEVIDMFLEFLPCDWDKFSSVDFDRLEAINTGHISPKLFELIEIFQCFGGQIRGRIDAKNAKGDFGCLSMWEVRSYVQSRGRARQYGSHYIVMLERGNMDQRNLLIDIIRSEHSMTASTLNRDLDSRVSRRCHIEEPNTYSVGSTGASVTADSSVNLIYKFCKKLPKDMYFTPKPSFSCTFSGGLYGCELTLPPNALLQRIVGPRAKSIHLAKQLACLEACKKLHESGALNDHLLPDNEEPLAHDEIKSNGGYFSGAGTTKRKELHGTTTVRALSGSWGGKTDGISLYAYIIHFTCNQVEEFYSSFVLLIEAKLDDDVAKTEVDLFMINDKLVKSSISPYGVLHLNEEQVKNARLFQEFFFNGLFGKLYIGSRSSGIQREFLLKDENRLLWSRSNMYMLLPLEETKSISESLEVDWRGINACASAIEFVKGHFSVVQENFPSRDNDEAKYKSSNLVCLANTSVLINDLKDMVVLAIHTGKIYSVLEPMIEMSAESSFDGEFDVVPSSCISFKEYFKEKYGIVLHYPGQPLLRLKQSHNPHNLLSRQKNEGSMAAEKTLAFVHMPGELLVPINVSLGVVKSFYLLPSLMHRLESLMLAIQLREEISCGLKSCYISSSLILEALTSLRCCEDFSLERLELLGDSVLKYAVSCTLFLKYPNKHEGQLSSHRSYAVCNSTLHKLGTNCKLQGYIRDSAFDPRRWVAPGQRSLRPVPCHCGVDTSDVPLESKFVTEDTKIVVGKACDGGHRWICSKTISDCVEALIGAYYMGGGLTAALMLMKWLGVDVELEPMWIEKTISNASLLSYTPESNMLPMLESKIHYSFTIKGLLLEAITHASQQELGYGFCYQRLEFLGDSVLDLLITHHLFQSHQDIDPGELTDLRSASVNNENFAKIAIRHDLQKHLQHSSGLLLEQITKYAEFMLNSYDHYSFKMVKCPKALGDLVESIAGAILIDTKLNLGKVWRIFKPLLSPIITPDKLELPPFRELNELCSHCGYFIKETCTKKEEIVHVEIWLQLEDILLKGTGCDKRKKVAKGQAALQLLKDLEKIGITHSRHASRENLGMEVVESSVEMHTGICKQLNGKYSTEPSSNKKKPTVNQSLATSTMGFAVSQDLRNLMVPVLVTINNKRGGPRSSLYDLCKRMQWPMPTFHSSERQSRSSVQIGCGPDSRMGFNIFVSKIKLHIPNLGAIEQTGEEKADKKSSQDSAALTMLYWLGKQGRCAIVEL